MRREHDKVAIYIRVSTVYQVDKDSLPMQRSDLVAYSKVVLNCEDYEIFEDAGYSGKNTDRPAFQDMMRRVRDGEFSHILVWKIDRISRNLLDFANMYEELKSLDVTFVSKNEQFQTNTAMGEAMLKIILVFAELERNMTSERVTATMIDRASKGIWNGGRIPYGYDFDYENKIFSINEKEAEVVRFLYSCYLEHRSLVYIVKYLDEHKIRTRLGLQFSPTTVQIILRNPFYIGTYRYNYAVTGNRSQPKKENDWVIVEDHHPAIIERSQFLAVGEILDLNARMIRTPGKQCVRKNTHVFGGLMYCGVCGKPMHSTPGRKTASGWRPSKYNCPQVRRGVSCNNSYVNDTVIGEFMINLVLNILNSRKIVTASSAPETLEKYILQGNTFSEIAYIEPDCLNELLSVLVRSDVSDSNLFKPRKPKKADVAPEMKKIRAEKLKIERALDRLKKLYLYSDDSMTENEYIIEKSKLTDKLEEYNEELGSLSKDAVSKSISDEDFIRVAGEFILSRELQDRQYIYYRKLAEVTSPEVLHSFFCGIVDSITVRYSRITNVIFLNGLSLSFVYNEKEEPPIQ